MGGQIKSKSDNVEMEVAVLQARSGSSIRHITRLLQRTLHRIIYGNSYMGMEKQEVTTKLNKHLNLPDNSTSYIRPLSRLCKRHNRRKLESSGKIRIE